ncbi:MAG: glycosyltransferase [Pyrinomonadaceae bacterium]
MPFIRDALDASAELAGLYEIIVCDNNSSDATAEIARLLGCEVVFEPLNQISRARNTFDKVCGKPSYFPSKCLHK